MKDLMVHVERAVRPIHASPTRKRRMRQELLAHLTALFEEERAHSSDEQALAHALGRFGNPAELTRNLQASVPLLDRWEGQMFGLFLRRSGESAIRHALRLAAFSAAFVFCGLLVFPLIRVAAGDVWSAVRIGLAMMSVITGYVFLAVLMGYGLAKAICGPMSVASLRRAAAYGAAVLLVGIALIVGGYLVQPENALWEFILRSPSDPLALSALTWFAGTPLVAAVCAALGVRAEMATDRALGGWRSLEISE